MAERVAAERSARSCAPRSTPAATLRARAAPSSAATSRWPPRRPRRSSGGRSTAARCARAAARDARSRAGSRWWPSAPLTVYDGAHNPAGARGAGRGAARGARRPPPACGRGRRARGQGRGRDAGARCCRCSTARCSPAAPTRARCRRPRSRAWPSKLGGPPAETGARTRAPPGARRASWPGRDGAVLATGSIYLIADLVREDTARPRLHAVIRATIRGRWTAVTDRASAR